MKEYRKFLLLTCPRSGTHMLKSSLEANAHIVCLTEMFNPDYIQGKYDYDDKFPAKKVLNNYIYCDRSSEIKAVGFCHHRIGAKFGNWPKLLNILRDMEDIYIISLSRQNLLRRYLSVQLQQIKDLDNVELQPITFDYDRLLQDFERQRKVIAQFNHRFRNHPILQVTYENLCTDYEQVTTKIQEFLGVPIAPVQPGTGRRNTPSLANFVTNYDQLKAKFSGTEWSDFFDD